MKVLLDKRLKHEALVVYEEDCVQARDTREEPVRAAVYSITLICCAKD